MDNKFDVLKLNIYNTISNEATRNKPIKARDLCLEYNITFRQLKQIITALRQDYAIVSKETNGGGYWIAEDEQDILQFIKMIERRKTGYEDTIKIMNEHLINFNNLPYVD